MKRQTKCFNCGKTFWSNAVKNKLGETVILESHCQTCKNIGRHTMNVADRRNVGNTRVRAIPSELNRQITARELAMAEIARRRKEKDNHEQEKEE